MTWVKLDAQFVDHPKVVEAGPLASWLYVCGLTYSARVMTDGFIPYAQVRRLIDVDDPYQLAEALVVVGLWEARPDGFQIHDYADHQMTKADIEKKRQAGRAGGQARAQAKSKHVLKQNPSTTLESAQENIDIEVEEDREQEDNKTIAAGEPPRESEPEPKRVKPRKKRDIIWDALVETCGAPETTSEKSDFGKTVKELKQAEASLAEVIAFAPWWRRTFDGATLTHRCYRQHFGKFRNAPARASPEPSLDDIKNPLVRAAIEFGMDSVDDQQTNVLGVPGRDGEHDAAPQRLGDGDAPATVHVLPAAQNDG